MPDEKKVIKCGICEKDMEVSVDDFNLFLEEYSEEDVTCDECGLDSPPSFKDAVADILDLDDSNEDDVIVDEDGSSGEE